MEMDEDPEKSVIFCHFCHFVIPSFRRSLTDYLGKLLKNKI